MERIQCITFASEVGQHKTAEMPGVRQSDISKAILKKTKHLCD
ncbi:Cro/CI family transcriptional regulator [Morganella morganii]|nr:hypothetical protein [Morganella morganii]